MISRTDDPVAESQAGAVATLLLVGTGLVCVVSGASFVFFDESLSKSTPFDLVVDAWEGEHRARFAALEVEIETNAQVAIAMVLFIFLSNKCNLARRVISEF